MIQVFEYKSTGVKHKEEEHFFQFVIKSRFNEENNQSLQWCRFDGLKVVVETLEPSIVDFVKLTLKNIIKTNNGHKYELI